MKTQKVKFLTYEEINEFYEHRFNRLIFAHQFLGESEIRVSIVGLIWVTALLTDWNQDASLEIQSIAVELMKGELHV